MESDYHQTKEDAAGNLEPSIKETKTSLISVKLEPETVHYAIESSMKVEDNNPIDGKPETEVKQEDENEELMLNDSTIRESKTNLIYIKLENETEQYDELLLATKCKLEVEDDKYDEFCNRMSNDILSAGIESSIDHNLIDIKRESEIKEENEEPAFKNECKPEIDVETYDEFCNTDAKSIYLEECNKSLIKLEKTSLNDSFESGTDDGAQSQDIVNTIKRQKCDKCDFVTKHKHNLKRHLLKHTEAKPFKCDKCSFQTKSNSRLQNHQNVHNETRPFGCNQCEYSAKSKQRLQQHQLRHTNLKPFKCDECPFSTRNKYTLRFHQISHKDSSEVEKFSCLRCDYVTKFKRNFVRHELKHLDPSQVETLKASRNPSTHRFISKINSGAVQSQNIDNKKTRYKCDKCDYATEFKYYLKNHQIKHTNEKQFLCDKCPFRTKTSIHLRAHQLGHMKPFKCDKCTFQTKHEHYFKKHQSVHEGRNFSCTKCDFVTKYKNSLLKHQFLVHLDSSTGKTFKCELCSYSTIQRNNLKEHLLTHEDSFKCSLCDYVAKVKEYLTRHVKKHH